MHFLNHLILLLYLINPVPACSRSESGNEPEQETTDTNLVTTTSKNIPIPDCLKEDKGCAIDPTSLVEDPFNANSWEICQTTCQLHSSCNYFVWYGPESSPFINTCFLLDQICDPETECPGCVSGEPYCEVCSFDELTCTIDAGNFIEMMPNIYEEKQCQDLCSLNDQCHFYTNYKDDSDEFPSTCILLNSCNTFEQCESCRTGPKECRYGQPCYKNEAVLTTGYSGDTKMKIGVGKQQVYVKTMGCSTNLNILAVGGGGTGGKCGLHYHTGGGGSGYINYTSTEIPYTIKLNLDVGYGGDGYNFDCESWNEFDGERTTVTNDKGNMIVQAMGGKRGDAFTGGNGYSGGGGGNNHNMLGGSGGSNGGDGNGVEDSNGYYTKGGVGSGFDISELQTYFKWFVLRAAPGNSGDKEIGGGGGGLIINDASSDSKEKTKSVRADTVSYGQGGDGKYGESCKGGVVLIELDFNVPN